MKSRTQRREEATARQAAHNALTLQQKLAKLDKRRGRSARERARLTPTTTN